MDDYAAFYRHARRTLEGVVDTQAADSLYPEPKEHCDICRWQARCDKRRRSDDHLCLVANISGEHTAELQRQGITTVSALASMPLPLTWKPDRGAGLAYPRLREQARIQEQQARWLLAQILDWHRREEKALWWEHFRLAALAADDLLDERPGLAGLDYVGAFGGTAKAPIHRYSFPPQETELRGGEDLRNCGGDKLGTLDAISLDERWVEIKKRQDTAMLHPVAIYSHTIINTMPSRRASLSRSEAASALMVCPRPVAG